MSAARASPMAYAIAPAARQPARIAPVRCRAALGAGLGRRRSLQLLQIMKDGDQLVRGERHLRHEIAGFDVLRIGNPGCQIASVSWQGARGYGFPAGDVREIRAELSAGER